MAHLASRTCTTLLNRNLSRVVQVVAAGAALAILTITDTVGKSRKSGAPVPVLHSVLQAPVGEVDGSECGETERVTAQVHEKRCRQAAPATAAAFVGLVLGREGQQTACNLERQSR